MMSCNNSQWLCIHIYVVLDWIRVLLLLNILKVEGQGADSLFGMIVSALYEEGGLSREEMGKKLICFGANGVNVFQGHHNGCTIQMHDYYAPLNLGVHCMAHKMNMSLRPYLYIPW